MKLSISDIKEILDPKRESLPSDDFRIIDSWTEFDEDSDKPIPERPLKYLCYKLEVMNPETGERQIVYKALKFCRVIRLPKSAKESKTFMDMHSQVLSGVYENEINLVTIIANIINPPVGLLFLYGVQGISDNIEDAKTQARYDYEGFVHMMQGTYQVMEIKHLQQQEGEWLRKKMYDMEYLTVVRGIPKANEGGVNISKTTAANQGVNPNGQGTLEEIILGMADYEYIIEVLSTPVYKSTLQAWSLKTEQDMTDWNEQLQGQKSLSLSLSIPMMYMANQSNSNGWSEAYSDASSTSHSTGESFNTGYGENVGQSLSQSYGQALGHSEGSSFSQSLSNSQSFTEGVTHGQTVGETLGQTFGITHGETLGETHGITQGLTVGHTEGDTLGYSHGLNHGTSQGQNIGTSMGSSVGNSFSKGLSLSNSIGQSLGQNMSNSFNESSSINHTDGNTIGETQGSTYGQSLSHSSSQSHSFSQGQSQTIGNSQSFGTSQNSSYSSNVGNSIGQNTGYSNNDSSGWSDSSSTGHSYGYNAGRSLSDSSSANSGSSMNSGSNVGSGDSNSEGGSVNAKGIGYNNSQGHTLSIGLSNGKSITFSLGDSNGTGASMGQSEGVNDGSSHGTSASHSEGFSRGVSSGVSYGNGFSKGAGLSSSTGITNSYGFTGSESNGVTNGISAGESSSVSRSLSNSQSSSDGWGKSLSYGSSVGTSYGQTQSQGLSQNMSMGSTQGQSYGTSTGSSVGISDGTSDSTSMSRSASDSTSMSQSTSDSLSKSVSNSQSFSQSNSKSYSESNSTSQSYSQGITQGQSVGKTSSQSYTENVSQGATQSVGSSKSVSQGQSVSNGTTRSLGQSMGTTGAYAAATGGSMGLGPSIGYSKSYQWMDQQVKDILELLEFQNERIKNALRGNGAFYTYVYIACPNMDALSAAKALAKSTWQNEYAYTNPLEVLDLKPEEQKHLLYHFSAFSSDITRENVAGVSEYKYSTVLLPSEFVAYTHPPRVSEGGIFAEVNDIPKFSVPSMLQGEIFMGTILSSERFTMSNGYKTPFDYRIDEEQLMHGYFTGQSRSGKTVAALRFAAELAHVRRKATGKRLRIVAMDPKSDWRALARFVEPERFKFYSLGDVNFHPIHLNPCKIPYGVWPQFWIDGLIDIYCRAYGLLERGKQMMGETIYALYKEAGVFDACDKPNWKEIVPELSKKVTFRKIYKRMESIKVSLEDPKNPKGKAGNDTRDAYARLLDRLQAFDRDYSIESKLFADEDGMGVDDLIGDDDVTVLESSGLESTFSSFIFGIITSGFYKYAKAQEGGYKAPDQYETVLFIEEANKVLTGNDTCGTGGGGSIGMSGQSEFEEMLDQAAGYGLFIMAITQKIADMPSSVIANAGLIFAGRLARPDDVSTVIRSIAREEKFEDRDIVKWLPKSPTGWFICKSGRTFDYKEGEPVLVNIAPLDSSTPTNDEIDEIMIQKKAIKVLSS